jgi:hypothetical protein
LVTAVRDDINACIERIVEAAQIPSRGRRDELRRELRSHFEESGPIPEALDAAVARFGNTAQIGDSFRKVYKRDYMVFYLAKIGGCVAAAAIAAILIEAIASLRLDGNVDAWSLSPRFVHAAAFGVVLTVAAVAAAEAARPPFAWSRVLFSLGGFALVSAGAWLLNASTAGAFATASILAAIGVCIVRNASTWPLRALLTLAAFAAAEYLRHQSLGITFGPIRAVTAGAILLMLWASTMAIVAFADRAFGGVFKTT